MWVSSSPRRRQAGNNNAHDAPCRIGSGDVKELSEEFRKDYPIREGGFLKPLGGFDIYRSPNLIMAIVAVETQNGARDIRFYRWQLRKGKQSGEEAWKVDLARFSVGRFDFKAIAEKVERLRQLFP
jgi:hypothetical protein